MGNILDVFNNFNDLEETVVISHSKRPEYFLNPEQVKNLKHHKVCLEKAFKYAKDMEKGDRFPPVQIFFDNKKNRWCCKDGAHRTFAAKMTKAKLLVRSKNIMRENR